MRWCRVVRRMQRERSTNALLLDLKMFYLSPICSICTFLQLSSPLYFGLTLPLPPAAPLPLSACPCFSTFFSRPSLPVFSHSPFAQPLSPQLSPPLSLSGMCSSAGLKNVAVTSPYTTPGEEEPNSSASQPLARGLPPAIGQGRRD